MKADKTNRFIAKFIDVLVALALAKILPDTVGFLSGLTYLLLADGIPPNGQSLGKRFIGLKVLLDPGSGARPCVWKNSMIRNIPFVLSFVGMGLGFFGILIIIVGLVLVGFEAYFVATDDQGIRLGDIFANTKVINA